MRILVVKLSSLGDLFHALPAVHAIKTHFDADIDWVTQREYASLVECFTDVDRVITTERRAFLRNMGKLKRELRSLDYDIVVDLQGLLKSAIVTGMVKGARKVGPPFHREGSRIFYGEIGGAQLPDGHAVDQAMAIAAYLGCATDSISFPVSFSKHDLEPGHQHVGLLPKTRWPSKTWPGGHYVDLAKDLLGGEDVMVHLMGGPEDTECCDHIANSVSNDRLVNHAGEASLPELGGLLGALDLLISGDSGPVHMAAVVGTPALVLFGPTNAGRTGPYGDAHRVIRAPAPCEPCYDRTCRRHGEPCLAGISAETVAAAARNMLET